MEESKMARKMHKVYMLMPVVVKLLCTKILLPKPIAFNTTRNNEQWTQGSSTVTLDATHEY